MWKNIIQAVLVLLAAVAGIGCNNQMADEASTYRTVAAEPHRDTEQARQANELGRQYLTEGKLEEAAEAFELALTADVEFGPAHNNLGMVYYRQKDWYKAAWEFEDAKKLMPRHAEPRNNLGLVLEQSGELDRAVEEYRQAVAMNAKDIQYRANLARALVRRGDRTEEVRNLLNQILQEDTRPAWLVWANEQRALMLN